MRLEDLNDNNNVLILGGQHGDEKTAVEIVRPFSSMRSPQLKVISCLNHNGYKADTRECDGVDLNRMYMLSDDKTPALVKLVKNMLSDCSLVIDVHSTWDHLLKHPCCIVDENTFTYGQMFNVDLVNKEAPEGSLRNYCQIQNIPIITYEAVEYRPLDNQQISIGINGILNILADKNVSIS